MHPTSPTPAGHSRPVPHGRPAGRRATFLLSALLLVPPLLATSPAVAAGAAADEGPVRDLALTEAWRTGGEDDDIIIGAVMRVLADADGEVYVLDGQLSQVQVYSPAGEHLRTLSREGEGPGEVRRPMDMFFTPDGNLALLQTFPGRIVLVDPADGTPAGGYTFGAADPSAGSMAALPEAQCNGGNTVLIGIRMSFGQGPLMQQQMFVSSIDAAGKVLATYLEKENPIDFSNFVLTEQGMDFPWGGRMAIGPDGTVYLSVDRDAYRIRVHAPDGSLLRTIERPGAPPARDEKRKEMARQSLRAVAANYPSPLQSLEIEDTDPVLDGIWTDAEGHLWVRTTRSLNEREEGVLSEFDVLAPDGTFLYRARLLGPGDPLRDGVVLLPRGRVVVVTGARDSYATMQGVSGDAEEDEAPLLEIICYDTQAR